MENGQSGTSDKVCCAVKCEICLCTFVVAVKQPLCDSWAPGTDAMLFLRNNVLPVPEMALCCSKGDNRDGDGFSDCCVKLMGEA